MSARRGASPDSYREKSALGFNFMARFLPIAITINRRLFLLLRHLRRMIGLSV
jgi:hypothetical protein